MEFASAKQRSADGEELNTLVASAVFKAMKTTKKSKAKETSDSENYNEAETSTSKNSRLERTLTLSDEKYARSR